MSFCIKETSKIKHGSQSKVRYANKLKIHIPFRGTNMRPVSTWKGIAEGIVETALVAISSVRMYLTVRLSDAQIQIKNSFELQVVNF